jgi:hypothetical protein
MPVTRHTPKVPGISVASRSAKALRGGESVSSNPRGCASSEEFRTALDVILAATANLRDYRNRLSAEDHTAAVLDIEAAVEQISNGLDNAKTQRTPGSGVKRRVH